jgi:hypothetical protein
VKSSQRPALTQRKSWRIGYHPADTMPFVFIVPVWLLIVLVAVPFFFWRRVRFLGTHIIVASTLAILISFTLSISVLVAGARLLPTSRFNGILIFGLFVLALIGGGVVGLAVGIFLAHSINKRLAWWPVPDS